MAITFNQLSLRARLALGIGAVIAVMFLANVAALFGQQATLNAVDRFFDREDKVEQSARAAQLAMAEARRLESEFLLHARYAGVEEAESRQIGPLAGQLGTVHAAMRDIRSVDAGETIDRLTIAVETSVELYEAGVRRLVEQTRRLGQPGEGLEGRLQAASAAVDAQLEAGQQTRLDAMWLHVQRLETSYLRSGAPHEAAALELAVEALGTQSGAQLRDALRRYRGAFIEYVALRREIAGSMQGYLASVKMIEASLVELGALSADALSLTRLAVRKVDQRAVLQNVATGLLATLAGLLLAGLLVRNIRRSVDAGVRFAGSLAAGDHAARLPLINGSGELAALGDALNGMAEKLEAGHERDLQQRAELLRMNRTLRMISRCHENLMRAASAEELRASVCRTMVEEGGYSLVWAGAAMGGASLVNAEIHGTAEGRFAATEGGWQFGMACAGVAEESVRSGVAAVRRGEFGFGVALALPLRQRERVEGVLCIYANESHAFDEAEVALLQELADDLAYGLNNMQEARKRQVAEQALAHHANHDPATGLANRTLFNDRLRQAMASAERNGKRVAVLAVTLDRYRGVKASLGHDACNALLMHVAASMGACLRDGDTLARLLGNEFAVIVADMNNDEDVLPVAAKLLNAVKEPMRWQDNIVTTTASIGIALLSKDGVDASSILRSANAAMAHALGLGGNRFRFYAPEMNERTSRMFALEAELRRALQQQELVLHYQPRALASDGSLAGAEALVRWQHPLRGLVPPSEFIPLAESSGLIVPLGAWVIREVCRQQRHWREAGLPQVPVAVNLSPRQFREDGLVEHVEVALQENGVSPALFAFEITESTVMDDIDDAVAKLHELKAIGIQLSMDDFGTGHSSLSRLRDLPIDHLKIDQSFVRKLGSEEADEAICRSIIDLGHNLNMQVVAEGVESAAQHDWLREHRCDEIQGYLYSRPVPAAAFAELLATAGRQAIR